MNADRMPSGRSGVFDRLRAGLRASATWNEEPDPRGCYYQNYRCHGRQVTIHYMADRPNRGYDEYRHLITCEGHAVSEQGLHPDGEPTDEYKRWWESRNPDAGEQ